MCLASVTNILNPKDQSKTPKYGWKLFVKTYEETLELPHFRVPYKIKKNRWYTSSNRRILSMDDKYYPSGFHFYSNREDARSQRNINRGQVVKKIKYRDLVAEGIQNECKVMVAKKILICV